jgi:hypothetical protein
MLARRQQPEDWRMLPKGKKCQRLDTIYFGSKRVKNGCFSIDFALFAQNIYQKR